MSLPISSANASRLASGITVQFYRTAPTRRQPTRPAAGNVSLGSIKTVPLEASVTIGPVADTLLC